MANEVDKTLVETSQENENIENKDSKILLGYSDDPAEKDSLGVDKYFKALEEYILSCPTPTTIAIQGGWGTGKSTAMGIIRERIKDKTHVIEFNTWQYSKVSGQSLIIPLLTAFSDKINEIAGNDPEPETGKKKKKRKINIPANFYIHRAIDALSVGLYAYADKRYGIGNTLDYIKDIWSGNIRYRNGDASYKQLCEYFRELGNIHKDLEKSIKEIDDNKNFVVFIDDLDRLNPEDAVSLLEDLKTLLCIKKCVFVLALDQDIVNKGLTKKYGDDDKSSKDFFDKIIQLPFAMPVNQYNISRYIDGLKGDKEFIKKDDIPEIVNILETFGENNPRTIKRLLNILQLYSHVKDDNGKDNNYDNYIKEYFAILLIQIRYNTSYKSICKNVKEHMSKRDPFICLSGSDPDEDFWVLFEDSKEQILNKLPEIFNRNFVRLSDVLSMTTVTGEGYYGSIQEESKDIYFKLTEYAKKIYVPDGWAIKEETTPDESMTFTKDKHTTVKVVNRGKHVNLIFKGKPNSVKFILINNGKADLVSMDAKYNFPTYDESLDDIGIPYIMVFRNDNEDFFYLTRISTRDLDSIKLAGELLRENLK